MDIPLKAQPKVSMVKLLNDSSFNLAELQARNIDNKTGDEGDMKHADSEPRLFAETTSTSGNNYKLARTYSESEANNFDVDTGHRIYEDGKIRPKPSRTNSAASRYDSGSPSKLYSRSHNSYTKNDEFGQNLGLEDEYIPGLDFQHMVNEWLDSDASRYGKVNKSSSIASSFGDTTLSIESSYLDLNRLHALVAPQPIMHRRALQNSRYQAVKFDELIGTSPSHTPGIPEVIQNPYSNKYSLAKNEHRAKKIKSNDVIDPDTGDINYEIILNNLPPDFNDLPYSQRRRLVKAFSESIDYAQFSLYAKRYLADKFSSNSSGRNSRNESSNGSFSRRSRHDSVNTIAGRLLAKSSTDMRRLQDQKPKTNVDEKGAIVCNYVLGKIIGFGAWGTIRECTSGDGIIRAVKIVKSRKNFDEGDRKSTEENQKVLEVFRGEIQIWKKLKHNNILPLLEYFETDSTVFCFTDRIYGGTLFKLVSSWGLYNSFIQNTSEMTKFLLNTPVSRLLMTSDYITQITNALYYLHEEMGIVHGDLKLENVLVDDDGNGHLRMVLCDFGMSRVYSARLSRKSSRIGNIDTGMARSKSSAVEVRKPLVGRESKNSRHLFADDLRLSISKFHKPHGPSLQSLDLTPEYSSKSFCTLKQVQPYNKFVNSSLDEIDSELPHSHIGSLPYASPELLLPSPPPLGPSADMWALGVLLFTMCVGKLPFQHPYEPRLRAIIAAGQFSKPDLMKACLLTWILDENDHELKSAAGLEDPDRSDIFEGSFWKENRETKECFRRLYADWKGFDKTRFLWLYDVVIGCLQIDITKRIDLTTLILTIKEHTPISINS